MHKLNFPIETPEAQKFWASKHCNNRMKAIVAFSLDGQNAIDNLRRHGFPYKIRKNALKYYKQYLATPSMQGIYFSETTDVWWQYK